MNYINFRKENQQLGKDILLSWTNYLYRIHWSVDRGCGMSTTAIDIYHNVREDDCLKQKWIGLGQANFNDLIKKSFFIALNNK